MRLSARYKLLSWRHPIKQFLFLSLFIGMIWGGYQASRTPPTNLPLPESHLLQVGDWIVRAGTSADSKIIQYLSHSRYSHIGMIVQTAPEILIAHATTDDDPQHPDQVLLTPLRDFLAPDKASAFAIVRPAFLDAQQRQKTAQIARQQQGRAFVLTSKEKQPFYCTLLISQAVQTQKPSFSPRWQNIDIATLSGDYLFPQAMIEENVQWIFQASLSQ